MTSKDYTPEELENEIWKPVPGLNPDYLISNYGRCKILSKNKMVKPFRAGWKGKYLAYSFGGRRSTEYAHRAVLLTFVGYPPNNTYQCNHKDGDKHNNQLDNLEWVTPKENQQHRYNELGQSQNGMKNPANKYHRREIQKVIDLFSTGKYTQRKIAELTGIDYRYVNEIVHGRAWSHLKPFS